MTTPAPPPIRLTPSQLTSYAQNGYLHLPLSQHNLIDPTLLHQYTSEVRSLPLTHNAHMPYLETLPSGTKQLMRTENFVPYHADFSSLLTGPGLESILSQLIGDEQGGVALFKDKINYKLAKGNGFKAHLDAPAYSHITSVTRPGQDISHITANFAVDAASPANGCIEVVPGSHLQSVPLIPGGGAIDPEWEAEQEWVPVPLEEGDLLIFGSVLAHRSGGNESGGERKSVYATYYLRREGEGLREVYYQDRWERFPPDHERVPGKDYSAGVQRYAFAAPFTAIEKPVEAQTAMVQEVM
ncbi:phytanoyl-CoA dioxygenase like protein [Zymoseptoria brevis]|uniref:Phytanoyl-CoA dioxygenase like protein n=1 Tax=Zymoseptoria brevis TaxID=1047168 RepID=A0A0F4G897_9PEZI|nr:phytanoyl-CoA dioxygenase like protein [Zymoseptoria brevis]